ncbi:MAG: 50S ribosomal protein L34 [Gammaproteobacteria bacterium]|nr:50S ribosomal protein L34 [Gammaproteobacteria bacterium]
MSKPRRGRAHGTFSRIASGGGPRLASRRRAEARSR